MPEVRDEPVNYASLELCLRGKTRQLRYFDRPGRKGTILYVHGLGCSKADFLGMANEANLCGYRLVSYDHPGCGESPYDAANPLNIDDLAKLVDRFTTEAG
jgi:pimeloyl-ACP methyl ester carboxylesterase